MSVKYSSYAAYVHRIARDRKDVMEDEYFLRKFAAYCRDRENTRQDGKARMEVSIMGTYLGMMPAMDIDSNVLVYLIQLLLLPVYNCYNTTHSEEFSNLFLMITVTYLIMNKTCDRETPRDPLTNGGILELPANLL